MQLSIDGVRLDVLDEGSGTPIVLLHGFPLAKETWDQQAAALARVARVIRLDLRGLGASAVTAGPYLMEALAGDVAGVLDALGVERAVIAGHSLGGYVAFAFFRMFAERCLGLGIVCSRAAADGDEMLALRYELAERVEREGLQPIVEWYVPKYFAPEMYERAPETVQQVRTIVERSDPRGVAAMLRGIAARVSSEDLFSEIDVPLRVVAGTQDAIAPVAFSRRIADGVRSATLDVLDCGHMPLLEVPDALTASLEQLLALARAAQNRLRAGG